MKLFPQAMKKAAENRAITTHMAERRMAKKTDRKDFMSYILRYNDEKGMTRQEIEAISRTLVVAGSEAIATILSGAIYFLLQNPVCVAKAVD